MYDALDVVLFVALIVGLGGVWWCINAGIQAALAGDGEKLWNSVRRLITVFFLMCLLLLLGVVKLHFLPG